jgi:sulfite reductase alpha subunit-like flavoprotein
MSRTEELYVLYGSQTGNAEGAAKEFCETIQAKYTPDFFKQQNLPPIEVKTTCIQLDDFLEMNHADYTKCLVIFVSSYGMGQGR